MPPFVNKQVTLRLASVISGALSIPPLHVIAREFWLFLSRTYQGGDVERSLLQACDQDFHATTFLDTPNDVRLLLCAKA